MSIMQFDPISKAQWYANEHRKTDPGVVSIRYLPKNAGEREIRLLEVNNLMGERTDELFEPIDFGIDRGADTAHQLVVLDVTPRQWKLIEAGELQLPGNWSLEEMILFVSVAI